MFERFKKWRSYNLECLTGKKDFEVCVDKVKEAYKEKDYDKARNIMAEFLLILHGKREGLYGFIQYPTKQKVKEE